MSEISDQELAGKVREIARYFNDVANVTFEHGDQASAIIDREYSDLLALAADRLSREKNDGLEQVASRPIVDAPGRAPSP